MRGNLGFVDRFLDTTTMYRLVLYWLLVILFFALLFSLVGVLPYNAAYLFGSTIFLVAVSLLSNWLFARVFGAAANVESVYITALILALIIDPVRPFSNLGFLAWAAIIATASKYLLAFRRRHLFNPAALAVVVTSFALGRAASWWVDVPVLLPFVLVGGVLLVRKMRRFDLVWAFFASVFVTLLGFAIVQHLDLLTATRQTLLHSPIFFLAFVMLTEPLTTPPVRSLQMLYGALVGFFFVPQVHLNSFYFSPELALVIGNLFSWAVSSKTSQMLVLVRKRRLSSDKFELFFRQERPLRFRAGQYLEWTLPHGHPDDRGNRRYFTISSSPLSDSLGVGITVSPRSSTFKQQLMALQPNERIFAGHLAGDFVLPDEPGERIALVAGGIGVTPFVSMLRHLLDTGEKRDAVVVYSNGREEEIAYRDVLERAQEELGVRVVYTLTDHEGVPPGWAGATGRVDERLLRDTVPDYAERTFYLSGSQPMVQSVSGLLRHLGVKDDRIKRDYFPGFA